MLVVVAVCCSILLRTTRGLDISGVWLMSVENLPCLLCLVPHGRCCSLNGGNAQSMAGASAPRK